MGEREMGDREQERARERDRKKQREIEIEREKTMIFYHSLILFTVQVNYRVM